LQLYLWQRKGWTYVQGPILGSETFTKPLPNELKALTNIAKFGVFPSHFKILPLDKKFQASRNPYLFIGGNLASIVSMLGTPWEPKPSQEFLLFLEDIDEAGYKTDRLLTQLRYSRFFENCRGIVLGHFTKCQDYKKVFQSFSRSQKLPVYLGLTMGHQAPRIPMMMGTQVAIERGQLIFGGDLGIK
jgi:muramoyltetrapeptide carboxypeptidase